MHEQGANVCDLSLVEKKAGRKGEDFEGD